MQGVSNSPKVLEVSIQRSKKLNTGYQYRAVYIVHVIVRYPELKWPIKEAYEFIGPQSYSESMKASRAFRKFYFETSIDYATHRTEVISLEGDECYGEEDCPCTRCRSKLVHLQPRMEGCCGRFRCSRETPKCK